MKKIPIILITLFCSYQIAISQSLERYLKIAENANPEIEYRELDQQIFEAKIDETGNLDNTKFNLGFYVFPPETRLGAQRLNIGVQQSLPWPGTLKAQKSVAEYKSKEKYYDIAIAKKNLFFNVKKTYYELYQNAALLNIYKENKQVLDIYENMAMGALENNKAKMSDVLKIQTQKNELHSKLFSVFNTYEALSRQFNRLLDRDEDIQLYIPDSLSILDIPIPGDTVTGHPLLRKLDARMTTIAKEQELLRYEEKPEFSVSLDYIAVSKRKDIFPDANGRDILMPAIAVSVPVFTKQYDAKAKRLTLEEKQTEVQKHNQEQILKSQYDLAKAKLKNAILQVVAAQKNKDVIQRAIDSDLKAYETGKINYDNILRMQLQKIKYQIMEIQATKEAYIQKAVLEYLAGE